MRSTFEVSQAIKRRIPLLSLQYAPDAFAASMRISELTQFDVTFGSWINQAQDSTRAKEYLSRLLCWWHLAMICLQTIKMLLRRKFLFLFPSFFNINLLYMFKIIQIAKNWNDTCVRGLEISHWKVRNTVRHYKVRKAIAREISAKRSCVWPRDFCPVT